MPRLILGLLGLLFSSLLWQSPAQAKPLFVDLVDLSQEPRKEGCRDDHWVKLYPACIDHKAVYEKALTNAQTQTLPMMILWGFDACPGCRALEDGALKAPGPQSETFLSILGDEQKKAFAEITGGQNQIGFLRLRSKATARVSWGQEIGAVQVAQAQGSSGGIWSPMWMSYDSGNQKLTSESVPNGYNFCNFEQTIAYQLISAGLLPVNPDFAEFCIVPSNLSRPQISAAEKGCKNDQMADCMAFALHKLTEGKISNEQNIENFSAPCEYGSPYACFMMAQSYKQLSQPDMAKQLATKSCRMGRNEACRFVADMNRP